MGREAVKLVGMTIQTTVEENLKNFTIAKFHNEIFNKRMSEINGKRFENINTVSVFQMKQEKISFIQPVLKLAISTLFLKEWR